MTRKRKPEVGDDLVGEFVRQFRILAFQLNSAANLLDAARRRRPKRRKQRKVS